MSKTSLCVDSGCPKLWECCVGWLHDLPGSSKYNCCRLSLSTTQELLWRSSANTGTQCQKGMMPMCICRLNPCSISQIQAETNAAKQHSNTTTINGFCKLLICSTLTCRCRSCRFPQLVSSAYCPSAFQICWLCCYWPSQLSVLHNIITMTVMYLRFFPIDA